MAHAARRHGVVQHLPDDVARKWAIHKAIEKVNHSRLLDGQATQAREGEMVGRRHDSQEITAKLAQADELAAKGKSQREISKALGVSIMTYHRWKKMLRSSEPTDSLRGEPESRPRAPSDANSADTIRRLELENAQLRRLVTDMLLEKLKYEEELRARQDSRLRNG
jgi:transposase